MVMSTATGFGPAVLHGLAELGAVDAASGDLSLELGLSAWMRAHTTSLEETRRLLLEMRLVIVASAGLDEATEPLPFVGRSARLDVITLISCLAQTLRRGAAEAGCTARELAYRVSAALPAPTASAIGA
jgi:hypothetical protein